MGKKLTELEKLRREFVAAKAAKRAGKMSHAEFREVSDRLRHAQRVERAARGGTVATPAPIEAKAGVSQIGG